MPILLAFPSTKAKDENGELFTLRNNMRYSSLQSRAFWPSLSSRSKSNILIMNQSSKNLQVEPEKLIAERVNGWAAMLGFFAAVGAYLTTGQIIPGIV